MLRVAVLCAFLDAIAASVSEDQGDAVDENSLFQTNNKQTGLGAGSTNGSTQFDVQGCAKAFMCAAAAGSVQKSFGGFKGIIAMGGAQVACDKVIDGAEDFFNSISAKNHALEVHKAKKCIDRKYNLTVKKCAQKVIAPFMAPYKNMPGGMAMWNKSKWGVVSMALKQCVKKIAPNNTLNRTYQEALYTSCGYPDLAKLLKDENKPKSKLSSTESLLCSLAGMLFVEAYSSMRFTEESDKSIKEAEDIQDKVTEDPDYQPPDPDTTNPVDPNIDPDDPNDDPDVDPDDFPADIPIEEVAAPAEEGAGDAIGEAVGEALLDVLLL